MATPFLKWAGGKGKLAPNVVREAPAFLRYHEPFVGAGAVFFALCEGDRVTDATLNDLNGELISAFGVVRDQPDELLSVLDELSERYLQLDDVERGVLFYKLRGTEPCGAVHRAARLIFLNKTCYNGLYRVNRKGQFNVPHGSYVRPKIADRVAIEAASRCLKRTELTSVDFEEACAQARPGDFVYLDPPYQPLTTTASFTSYTSAQFGPQEQIRLSQVFEAMTRRGVAAMLSNSKHPFIDDLYRDKSYRVEAIAMSRAINSVGAGRAPIEELLVSNFDRPEVRCYLSSSPK